jgi:SP family general alpha glucoside:H+ symporter-like MFS transporter
MPYFGRRVIYLWGLAAMTVVLFLIGILNIHTSDYTYGISQSSLCLVWTLFFQLSVGQLGWALPAEVGSTRLRQKTVCLARNAYYIVAVVANTLQPYFMNPLQWNLKGYTGFIWGSTCFLTLLWAYFRLPETKGKTFEELDMLFAQNVPAKKFATYEIDAFDEEVRTTVVPKPALM